MCLKNQQSCDLWLKKKIKKIVSILYMIWNYDHFSKQKIKSNMIYTLLNISYLLKKS